ncbi:MULTISPECIES: ABC transporter permease subunit [Halorubrum]|uniref:ABC transporter permease subunit n=1 Tax=Halorubrum ruber TaxID=2982524 RepID=A0A8T8LI08_9EURY|nr:MULTISPECIES: ABC transporter permease subunit [Halorubrum]QUO46667.1 ABC transporter permease subunit [Halorubrum ruber]
MSERRTPWLAIARYAAAGRARGSLVVTGLLSAFLLLFLAFFPSLSTAGIDLDAYVEAFPPAFQEAFGIIAISSIEGFLAVEFYQFAWLLLVGLYLAYLAGGTIAGDVASGRMDLTLSAPVARRDVVIGRFLGLVPLVVLLNVVLPVVAYVGVLAVGETIAVERLVAVHALAVPYHLTCVAVGIAVSTLVSRPGIAQRVALGALFALFMFESVVASTDYAEAGDLSPTAHYDPSAVLVLGEYDLTGAAVLLAATTVLVALAVVRFRRADLSG